MKFAYSMSLGYIGTGFNNAGSSLNVTITPTYANKTFGTVAQLGKNLTYTILVTNNDKTRPVSQVKVTFRPSTSCLLMDEFQFKSLVTSKTIAKYEYNQDNEEFYLYFRGIAAGGSKSFNVNQQQKFGG
jgi:hypothetical protein